ncbi:MAG: Bacterial membrane protein YfhO [Microgenomates bacterium OLB23]|nr:MAG: Bacterial membrane protein YfhO [Microgenomates bacterium OLB23]
MRKYTFATALLVFFLATLLFFIRLFTPEMSLFITPDFGQSDLMQLNYPAKYSLLQALQNKSLPLWNGAIGTGFPQLAEGQIGVFNIVNLVLYSVFSFEWAINIGYVAIFFIALVGTYTYLRYIGISAIAGLIGAFIFAYSGIFITQISHINLIHASSYIPWVFLCTHAYIRTRKLVLIPVTSLVISQQFFAGFPQISFITLCGAAMLYLFLSSNRKSISTYLAPAAILLLFMGLSAVQLLPSREFLEVSTRKDGFLFAEAARFSYPWKHLITFLQPNALGSAKHGTYPPFHAFDGSIYWENTGYIGILPLLFAAFILVKKRSNVVVRVYALLLFVSLLLMTGKHSPLYFIFTFPPFNYFRVPSRYIHLFVWSLTILSSLGIHQFIAMQKSTKHGRLLIFAMIMVILYQLFTFGWNYNATRTAAAVLAPPPITEYVPHKNRYYVHDDGLKWNDHFITKGWVDTEPYIEMRNILRPNANLLHNASSFQAYPILLTRRFELLNALVESNITTNKKSDTFDINTTALKILQMSNVDTLVSAYKNESLQQLGSVKGASSTYYAYRIENVLPRAYFVYNYKVVKSVDEFTRTILDSQFNFATTVLLEKPLSQIITSDADAKQSVDFVTNAHTRITLTTNTVSTAILVLSDLYYPGWKAYVDNKETAIFAANLSQRAIVVPKGSKKN